MHCSNCRLWEVNKLVTFEEVMEKMAGMSPEEMQAKIKESAEICKDYCGNCPSYEDTGETALVFCATGKSDKIKEEKGCLCPGCPIQTDLMGLRWDYYCTKGSAREQLAAEK
jgi:hypothetical protein